jgi:hypothetical protein
MIAACIYQDKDFCMCFELPIFNPANEDLQEDAIECCDCDKYTPDLSDYYYELYREKGLL